MTTGIPSHPTRSMLLEILRRHRFATSHQLARFIADHYTSTTSATRQTNRHLANLAAAGLVQRLERQVGGWRHGSTVGVWTLTTRGHRFLTGGRQRQRPGLLSTTFIEHTLAVADVHARLVEATRNHGLQLDRVQTEPDCWRPYLDPAGQAVTLRPDLAAEILSVDYRDCYLFEIDRATENPARVIRTCWQYATYRATGIEQQRSGVFPAVIWIVPHARRRIQVARYLDHEPGLPSGLFTVITPDQIDQLVATGPSP